MTPPDTGERIAFGKLLRELERESAGACGDFTQPIVGREIGSAVLCVKCGTHEHRHLMRESIAALRHADAQQQEIERLVGLVDAQCRETRVAVQLKEVAEQRCAVLEAENRELRESNESVAMCAMHTDEVTGDGCLVCEAISSNDEANKAEASLLALHAKVEEWRDQGAQLKSPALLACADELESLLSAARTGEPQTEPKP